MLLFAKWLQHVPPSRLKKSDPRPLQPKGPAAKAKAKAKAAAAKKKVIKAPGRHKKPGRAARVSS